MLKTFSYYVVRVVWTDDLALRKSVQRELMKAGLGRKTFPMTKVGLKKAEKYLEDVNAFLSKYGLVAVCKEGFSMTFPE